MLSGLKAKLTELMALYGPVALGVWFVLFGLTLGGFMIAIRAGFDVGGAGVDTGASGLEVGGVGETVGTFGAAYLATQLTKPIRIGVTLFATPFVARFFGRHPTVRPAGEAPPDGFAPPDSIVSSEPVETRDSSDRS